MSPGSLGPLLTTTVVLTRVLPMARLRLIAALFFAFGLTAIAASLGLF